MADGTGSAGRKIAGGRAGFTLIEVLVAVAIVSIALLAALRAAGQGTTNADELRSRLLAGWVAENRLAEHRARGDWLPLGMERGTGRQGGAEFAWREEVTALPNPDFRRVDVFVYAASDESRALARLTGFVVRAPGAPR
jgi:general secretion pathway protein I